MNATEMLREIKRDFLAGEFTPDKSIAVDQIDELEGEDETDAQDR